MLVFSIPKSLLDGTLSLFCFCSCAVSEGMPVDILREIEFPRVGLRGLMLVVRGRKVERRINGYFKCFYGLERLRRRGEMLYEVVHGTFVLTFWLCHFCRVLKSR
jgi:hypothetical protein